MQNKISNVVVFATIFSCITSFSITASEQPTAKSLVERDYIGAHGIYYSLDDDRWLNQFKNSALDSASGVGLEYGYRLSETIEARFSYSHLNVDTKKRGYDVASGSNTAFDLLYFPTKKNVYVIAGANFLDVDDSNLSPGIGGGYRYYFNQNAAFYIEGQGQYQLDNDHVDFMSKVGFVYFLGDSPEPLPQKKTMNVASAKVIEKDSDKDGVFDNRDQCPRTPHADKVDSSGCTVFTTDKKTMKLLVKFDHDESVVKAQYHDRIETAAKFLQQYEHIDLTINGHTSEVGDAQYNQTLSLKRAQAIVEVLVNKFGISAERLTAIGHGESQLVDTGNSVEAHQKNRRIEAKVVVKKKRALKR